MRRSYALAVARQAVCRSIRVLALDSEVLVAVSLEDICDFGCELFRSKLSQSPFEAVLVQVVLGPGCRVPCICQEEVHRDFVRFEITDVEDPYFVRTMSLGQL